MPCGCTLKSDEFPETAEWGPLFWIVLHGLSVKAGYKTDPLFQMDERRVWIRLLNTIGKTLPCDVCRNHYKQWRTEHPVEFLLTSPYEEMGEWIRKDLWSLHNEINVGNNKPVYAYKKLQEDYKQVDITNTWKALEPVMLRAMRLHEVSLLNWNDWKKYVRTIQGMY
jgi:hypothetical protein